MFLAPYYSQDGNTIAVSGSQASHFAKGVAGDFNPIHDEDARKFCVPGDLIFALLVQNFGVHERMAVRFLGPVGADVPLVFPEQCAPQFVITNEAGKALIDVQLGGEVAGDTSLGEALTRQYVAFSGHSFPDILVPLMADEGVMINPARPLVMYESMALEFDHLRLGKISLAPSDYALVVDGKRGGATLGFDVLSDGEVVGRGAKKLALGGLQPYDQTVMDQVISDYQSWKDGYAAIR